MGSSFLKLACVVTMCMVVAAPYAEGAITCGMVTSKLLPCLSYLQNGGGPSPACCGGVKDLNNMAKGTPARQAACGCLKNDFRSFPGIKVPNAAALPGKCGVDVGYPISPSVDCSRVN